MQKPALKWTTAVLVLFVSGLAEANGTDTGPGAPINTYPFDDTGFLDETSFGNDTSNYSSSPCSNLPVDAYAGADVFYQFQGATDSTYDFVLTSDTPGSTDFMFAILTDFNDGLTCVAHSQDSIDDISPEELLGFSPQNQQVLYLVVDAYSDEPGYPAYGSWSLNITCTGSCPAVTTQIFNDRFEAPN